MLECLLHGWFLRTVSDQQSALVPRTEFSHGIRRAIRATPWNLAIKLAHLASFYQKIPVCWSVRMDG